MKIKFFLIFAAICISCSCAAQSTVYSENPLFVLDGKVLGDAAALKDINPDDIDAIDVIKYNDNNSEYLDKIYGAEAKRGVVIIKSKAFVLEEQNTLYGKLMQEIKKAEQTAGRHLFVKDGLLVPENQIRELKRIAPADLTAVEILTEAAAKAVYGENAKETTILINTKKAPGSK